METARVRFLETRVVDDANRGTVRETRFEAGETYELDARSADRWVKRGAARFLSDEDERKAGGASGDVALILTDKTRKDPAGPGGNPGEVRAATGSPEEIERFAIVDRIATTLVAEKAGLSSSDWSSLSASEQLELLRTANGELAAHMDGLRQRREPTGLQPATEGVSNGGSDTDGDQFGDIGAGGTEGTAPGVPVGEQQEGQAVPPAEVDVDAMTDEQLRDFIDQRDGKRPRRDASRETLLAKAKEGAAA